MCYLNAQAQSATVPCRLSCGQCSDARFVFNACILDMYLIHVDMYLIHVDLRLLVWRESHVIAVNVPQGCFVARCIKFVLCCHMCVSCVSQSSFIQRCRHVYSYKHIRRLPWIPPCGAAWSAARSYHDLLLQLNTPLRSGLVSRSLVARPSCDVVEIEQSLEATRELDVSCCRPEAQQK